MSDKKETKPGAKEFDFDAYPPDTFFHERREGRLRPLPIEEAEPSAAGLVPGPGRPPRKERRRRIDPTTFEKQYNVDELEFMNAMQHFKVQSCKTFPSYGDVLNVAYELGYRKNLAHDRTVEESIAALMGRVGPK